MEPLDLDTPLVRALLQHAPVGIVILDHDARHVAVNAEWCRQTGLTPAAAIGKTSSEVWGTPESAAAEREQRERIRSARPLEWQDYTHLEGEETVHYRWGLSPVVAEDGRVFGAVAFTLKVTDQVNAERALAALQRAEQDRDLFLAALGHDLRGPLGVIRTGADLLLRSSAALQPDVQRIAARTVRSVSRMSRLISQLLDFARSRSGTIGLQPSWFDLREVCEEVATDAAFSDTPAGLELALGPACEGFWDRDRLEQVVHNLVANAIQHGAPPVRLSLRAEAGDAVLQVANQNRGPPIAPETLARLFEPFHHPDRERRTGLGLGLFIARSIVEAHRGTLTAESTADGTRFEVRLPRS
ncbi:PAS domain-containing sensor histidine kinase [Anaeromyxobacter terrae]|uniref:PAS domain-containing sensor histidine kinase n=1 Tax=Anaeromyxobacter terrae TaxID=2925406 RepID=UPI001F561ECA|nr:PAS domain-containing sensor histidine kinase [Anaeromyxobacter sp. SG22]